MASERQEGVGQQFRSQPAFVEEAVCLLYHLGGHRQIMQRRRTP